MSAAAALLAASALGRHVLPRDGGWPRPALPRRPGRCPDRCGRQRVGSGGRSGRRAQRRRHQTADGCASRCRPRSRPGCWKSASWLAAALRPHVRLCAAPGRRAGPQQHPRVPERRVGDGQNSGLAAGGWGEVPPEWTWALVCAPAAGSGAPWPWAAEATALLWSKARQIDPGSSTVVSRCRAADPVGARRASRRTGYYRRLWVRMSPRHLAGDWLVQPCVEEAVRSGETRRRNPPQLTSAPTGNRAENLAARRDRRRGFQRGRRAPRPRPWFRAGADAGGKRARRR
jgi:hypothetical protein